MPAGFMKWLIKRKQKGNQTLYLVTFLFSFDKNGPDGIRTHGLCVANAALSQLSYEPGISERDKKSDWKQGGSNP